MLPLLMFTQGLWTSLRWNRVNVAVTGAGSVTPGYCQRNNLSMHRVFGTWMIPLTPDRLRIRPGLNGSCVCTERWPRRTQEWFQADIAQCCFVCAGSVLALAVTPEGVLGAGVPETVLRGGMSRVLPDPAGCTDPSEGLTLPAQGLPSLLLGRELCALLGAVIWASCFTSATVVQDYVITHPHPFV